MGTKKQPQVTSDLTLTLQDRLPNPLRDLASSLEAARLTQLSLRIASSPSPLKSLFKNLLGLPPEHCYSS
jgi:hypothetical protein